MKTTLAALFALLVTVNGLPSRGGRIINGREARVGDVASMAALIITTPDYNYFCGGSVISHNFILTAGHCLEEAVMVVVSVGLTTLNSPEPTVVRQSILPANLITHAGFDPQTALNDIAVIRLVQALTYSAAILPINLPRRSDQSKSWVAYTGIVVGWGQMDVNVQELSNVLRWAENSIIGNNECSGVYPGVITANNLCATGYQERSICNGDNGGPIIVSDEDDFKLVGVVSFTDPQCHVDAPAVYTRVTPYLDWIQANTDVIIRP